MLELRYGSNPRVEEHNRKRTEEKLREGAPDTRINPVLLHDGDTDEIDGFKYRLVVEDDYHGDDPGEHDMVLGTLTESPEMRSSWKVDPDIARTRLREMGVRHYYYADDLPELYWNPMEELEELAGYYRKNGASKQVAREMALASEKSAMQRRLSYGESWNYVSVGVEVSYQGSELGSDYIGGVESDFLDNGYAEELIPELARAALAEARAMFRKLGLAFGVDEDELPEDEVHYITTKDGGRTVVTVYHSGRREEKPAHPAFLAQFDG